MSFKNLNRGLSCAFLACMFVAPAAMAAEKNVVEDNSFASQVKRIKKGVSIFDGDFDEFIGTVAELNDLGEYAKNNSQLLSSGVVSRVLRYVQYGNVNAGNNEIVKKCIKEIVRMMVNDVKRDNCWADAPLVVISNNKGPGHPECKDRKLHKTHGLSQFRSVAEKGNDK